ncbi:amino acid ABC transporter ATP-binding protein [Candidatus Haliotispira prima]|uniref:Amino acid ABC transporter ATP-binding protein n=1 Tax=Candidatus Haliotispira prima TaxID=3034016 RepID=A0ABY8MHI1_9SPIO|nr:amino acid ABC transporter ATP-binding protein [Candidatus Haliotispira prima]
MTQEPAKDKVILVVKHLYKSFHSNRHSPVHALKDINFTVQQGETVTIIGSSGSGKSTLLHCLNALEECNSGSVTIAGQEIVGSSHRTQRKIRQNIGMVFQQFNLFPHLTVRGNLNLAQRHVRKKHKDEANTTTEQLLRDVEIHDKIDSYPNELSGGQQQRVAIARALAMEPKLMLFDEPTSSLDPERVFEVLQVMRRLAQNKTTMLVVTHEMNFAREAADRVIFMDQSRIVEDRPSKNFFENPQSERAKEFLSGWEEKA